MPSFLQLFCHLLLFILPYLYLDVDSLMKCRIRILGTTPFLYKKPQYPHVHFWIKKFSQQFLIFGKGEKFRTEKGQKCERFAQIKYRNEALIFLINERIIPRGGVCFLKVVSQNNWISKIWRYRWGQLIERLWVDFFRNFNNSNTSKLTARKHFVKYNYLVKYNIFVKYNFFVKYNYFVKDNYSVK